jgi:ATP-dependent Clp protease ATP-binding subunit ClpB
MSSFSDLDPTLRSQELSLFQSALEEKIIGQQDAIDAIVDSFQIFRAGMCPKGRPVSNFLFLGPTGIGKTRVVEAAAEILFGTSQAVLKTDCGEFQHSHEIAKLVGSPPGYLGHRETHPRITDETLAAHHTADLKLSFLLFDEIEKASDALWQLLLAMLDKATLTLGDNRRVDLSSTMIFLTSNLGAKNITELFSGTMGFSQPSADGQIDNKIDRIAQEAAKKKFSPEFMNRLDKVVVFHPLNSDHLYRILEIELEILQDRILENDKSQFLFRATELAKKFLLRQGTDINYGARHLKRTIEKYVVRPMARLLSTDQVKTGDIVILDWDGHSDYLIFKRDKNNRFSRATA